MLLLRIIGPPAKAPSVSHTDELPQPIILDSDDQRLVIPWFSPVYAQPLIWQDELSFSVTTIVDDDYKYAPIGWQASVFAQPQLSTDELPSIVDDDYRFVQLGWQATVYGMPLRDTDEIPQPRILDEEFYTPSFSLTWRGTPQPATDTDEFAFVPAAVVEDDISWTQQRWQALLYGQPVTDTDEVSIPILLDDDLSAPLPRWQASVFAQPFADTDETAPAPATFVEDDLAWAQVRWQVNYYAQPLTDTDEVSVSRILEDEFWSQGFPRYLGYIAFAQPYLDDHSYHFIPPVVGNAPVLVGLGLTMIRLGGKSF